MRYFQIMLFLLALSSATSLMAGPVTALEIAPFKDRLFAYPAVIEARDGGNWRLLDYREERDINGRDQIPERRVKSAYVDLAARRATRAHKYAGGNYYVVGRERDASIITVFIHGAGGTGKLGINDHSFGGNFNRIKMLMLRNGGLYVSPDAGKFGAEAAGRIGDLVRTLRRESPRAGVVLACGSGGGDICYHLANDAQIAGTLSGIAFLGSYPDGSYLESAAANRRVPVHISHGSRDSVFPMQTMDAFYGSLREAGVPVRFVGFQSGSHGTPIRMTDWRDMLNWMLGN